MCVAWTTGGHNQLANVVAAKLDWTGDETRLYTSLINLASMVGKTAGAIYGGKLIQMGRKNIFVASNLAAIVTNLIMQYLSLPTLILGKLLNGFFVTVVHMACLKMINESVPVYLIA